MSKNSIERDLVEQFVHDTVRPAVDRFMVEVQSDALAAYDSDVMVAAGFKPFTLAGVKKRWDRVVTKLTDTVRRLFRNTDKDMDPLYQMIDGLVLPSAVYNSTVDLLEKGAAAKWSKQKLAERLVPVLAAAPVASSLVNTLSTAVYGIVQQRRFRNNHVPYKKWLSLHDDRVRESHSAADGQIQLADEPYTVGGALLMFPCDPSGPVGETVNCRCVSIGCNARGNPVADQTALGEWLNLTA